MQLGAPAPLLWPVAAYPSPAIVRRYSSLPQVATPNVKLDPLIWNRQPLTDNSNQGFVANRSCAYRMTLSVSLEMPSYGEILSAPRSLGIVHIPSIALIHPRATPLMPMRKPLCHGPAHSASIRASARGQMSRGEMSRILHTNQPLLFRIATERAVVSRIGLDWSLSDPKWLASDERSIAPAVVTGPLSLELACYPVSLERHSAGITVMKLGLVVLA